MISIIVSSAKPNYLKQVAKNIEDTIGVPYELISFDNSSGQKGICEIYNLGIKKARYEILCFMHEDIEIETCGWGKIVIDQFNSDKELGLLGVAGSIYKSRTPSGWHSTGGNIARANYIQSNKKLKKRAKHYYLNPDNEKTVQVACVDGVWFCTTKKITSEFMFDDVTFKKFHAYDLDISFAIGQKYKVAVTFEVLLNHFSEGNYDRTWMAETLKLHNKWNNVLPINIDNVSPEMAYKIEKNTFKTFIDQLLQFNYSIKDPLVLLSRNRQFFNRIPLLYPKLKYYIFSKYLKAGRVT